MVNVIVTLRARLSPTPDGWAGGLTPPSTRPVTWLIWARFFIYPAVTAMPIYLSYHLKDVSKPAFSKPSHGAIWGD